ncbi:MAG: N-acetyltransferase [Chloroflexi bacterium]|nr:N-acetyltransferase family protein [Ardenticatenaceae bacterium]MBL1128706.1 N-acetyltransferase family protein [Chloroflexota bacterium]NOG34785.1 N-acetyltransferase [Chloroflexota bacterium]GIK57535.1 MAG: N-acetyltransferase [Chloroflexota bacterium]
MPTIRPATPNDIPAITEIYNEAIIYTRNTFDTVPKTVADREEWYHQHMPAYPILVVEDNGEVVGFASVSKWSDRPAYGRTVIASEYIRQDYRGQGIGKALLVALLEAAYAAGYHTVMGNVYAGNEVSRRMVESIGFRTVGLLKEVGYKFDEWLDVYLVQHMKPPGNL